MRLVVRAALSPSSRRAWIEILSFSICARSVSVALLTEGVDRNRHLGNVPVDHLTVALLTEGVDRNQSEALNS